MHLPWRNRLLDLSEILKNFWESEMNTEQAYDQHADTYDGPEGEELAEQTACSLLISNSSPAIEYTFIATEINKI